MKVPSPQGEKAPPTLKRAADAARPGEPKVGADAAEQHPQAREKTIRTARATGRRPPTESGHPDNLPGPQRPVARNCITLDRNIKFAHTKRRPAYIGPVFLAFFQ
jgi:hypothetical protein